MAAITENIVEQNEPFQKLPLNHIVYKGTQKFEKKQIVFLR